MLSDVTTPQDLDENLRSRLEGFTVSREERLDPTTPVREGSTLTGDMVGQILDAQFASRHLDLAACWLRGFNAGFYTTASSGHEGNAVLAAALRPTDPVIAHYRSAALYCARSAQISGTDPIRDILRGFVASSEEPVSGGRMRISGNMSLNMIPTTSITGSHLPRAVGMAYAIGRGCGDESHNATLRWPSDAIVACSFGDGAVNHASVTTAFNAAGWLERSGARLPVLFICEDNGFACGVRSPEGWVADTLRFRPGLRYFTADGCDAIAAYDISKKAIEWVRKHRRPAVLHLTMVRLMGHTGEDAEQIYRTVGEIATDMARDPVVATAQVLIETGLATPEKLITRYDEIGWQVRRTAEDVINEPRLSSTSEVISTLAPRRPVGVARAVVETGTRVMADEGHRLTVFGGKLPEESGPMTLAQTMNAALADSFLAYPHLVILGQDVAAKGGLYSVTKGLRDRLGKTTVQDTMVDEISILGLGLGCSTAGSLPVIEIQHLSYLHNAIEQLRGEAATAQFLSQGTHRNPLVIRTAGLAYPPETDNHVRNDNALGSLRDVPGLVIAIPARAEDAAPLLRTCLASGIVDGSVSVFIEPIALYNTRDLYEDHDGWWQSCYAPPGDWGGIHVPIGRARVYPEGTGEDLTIITYGNGVRLALRAARRLSEKGVGSRVVDLRWLAPLPLADIMRESSTTGRVLIVDETRRSGGVGEGILAVLVDAGYVGAARRIAAVDSFIPPGPGAGHVLVGEEQIMQGARLLLMH